MTRAYYRGSHGILLLFDMTARATFDTLERWLNDIGDRDEEDVNVILISNKSDLIGSRTVTRAEGEALAAKHKVPYFETSALNGSGVQEAFDSIIHSVMQRLDTAAGRQRGDIELSTESKEGGCPC